ncbi:MAG: hypothetical protein R2772_05860 [Chitinophagales bacterium]
MPKNLINIVLVVLLAVFSSCYTSEVFGQASQISFGKNRVQYKDFDWQFYETDNFRIYFYQGGQDIGKYVILSSEKCLSEVNELLNFKLSKKLDIIVYNDISDMHQTNIGIKNDVESISGTVHLKNNKLFIYFNGKHSEIDRQIKEGIARLYLAKMKSGTGFQEVVQNTFTMNLPFWFTEGLVKYTGNNWDTKLENDLRQGILSGRFNNLSKLKPEEQVLVGHSIFRYIEDNYGEEAVANLLYLAKVNRSVESAFLFVTGKYMNSVLEDWYRKNNERFKQELAQFESLDEEAILALKKKKDFKNYQAKLSPDGRYLAYTSNALGRWKVMVYDLQEKKTRIIMKGGFKTVSLETDLSAPMLAWEPKGKKLSVIYEKRDFFYIKHFDSENFEVEAKAEILNKFQKVFDFAYAEDSRNLYLSAMQKGQIDIFKYYLPSNKLTNITNDFYDDLQVSYFNSEGRSGVLFISNRPDDLLLSARLDTLLPNAKFDVFFYDENNPFQALTQITQTPLANESLPQAFNDSTYTFLSDMTGINSQYVGEIISQKVGDRRKYVYSVNETDRLDSIEIDLDKNLEDALAQDQSLKEIISTSIVPVYKLKGSNQLYKKYYESMEEISLGKYCEQQVEFLKHNNKASFLLQDKDFSYAGIDDSSSFILEQLDEWEKNQAVQVEKIELRKDTAFVEPIRTPIFQSKFDTWESISEAHKKAFLNELPSAESGQEDTGYKFSRTRQYFLKFMTEDISFSLDNSLLVNSYQAFNPGNPVFNQPSLNSMIRFGITDLFEDHKIHGGIRLPFNFRGSEIYISYENFKKRWDKSLTYYRKSNSEDVDDVSRNNQSIGNSVPGTINTRTNLVESQLKYPFNQLNSMRFKLGFRNDRNIVKASDITTLQMPNSSSNWLYSRVEFVHDHTLNVAKNIKNGLRLNVYYEFQKEIPTREDEVLNQSVQLPVFNNSYLMLWGFDARHYQKLYKTIIWANRLAYSSSVGTKKMIYYLGGIDGMLRPQFNQETIVNQNNTYAFQSLALNMRGFQQNIRNGNSFMVWNSEIRIPIFSAFARKEIKSSFIREHTNCWFCRCRNGMGRIFSLWKW